MIDSTEHDKRMIKQAIKDIAGTMGLFTWYRRIVTNKKPTILIGEPQELPSTEGDTFDYIQSTIHVRVEEQSDLWQNMGQIPVQISRNTGFTMLMAEMANVKVGGYFGVVSVDYDVRINDHLVDADDNEYLVVSAAACFPRVFRRLSLEYLPKATSL